MGTPVQAGSNTNGNNINVWSNQRVDTPVAGGPGVTNTNTQNTAGDNSVTIGQQLTTGTGAVAVGRLSTALGDRAVAFGEEVHAKKKILLLLVIRIILILVVVLLSVKGT